MLVLLRAWWSRNLDGLDLRARITPDPTVPNFTVFTIGHQMPDLLGQPNRWRITTARQIIRTSYFTAADRDAIKRAFHKGKGRVIYAQDLARDSEIVAAITYHYDPRVTHPIVLRRIALRDVPTDDPLYSDSLRAALILKTHLHYLKAQRVGGKDVPNEVWAEAPNPSVPFMRSHFGFQPGKQVQVWRHYSNRIALEQPFP